MMFALLLALQCPDGSPPPCRAVGPRPAAARALDSQIIAVLPFRVSGADSTLAEGLAELLAAEFTGEGALRSADMGTLLRAWRAAGGGARQPLDLPSARRVATQLGAGRILTASVVGTGQRLSLSAQVVATNDGSVRTRAGPVQGTADSLPDLMRSIASQLMTTGVRGAFAGVPTEALRSYMAGRAAFRASEWREAARLLERALAIDSTFAYAALARLQTQGWVELPGSDLPRIQRLAWTYKDRLDPAHRALVIGNLGPRYPDPSTVTEVIEARLAATRIAPDNADAWMMLGDELAHRGELVYPDGLARALVAFDRALELEPQFSEAALHMSTAGLITGDLSLTRRAATHALTTIAPSATWVPFMRYDLAIAEGRGARHADSLVRTISSLPQSVLNLVPLYQTAPDYMDTSLVAAAIAERARRATTVAERRAVGRIRHIWLSNRGLMTAAASALDADDPLAPFLRIGSALYAGGDPASAAADVAAIATLSADGALAQAVACHVGLWHAQRGDPAPAQHQLNRLDGLRERDTDLAAWCAPLLEATLAVRLRSGQARAAVQRADSIIALGMPSVAGWEGLALAQLWGALGDSVAGLRAVRRREWFGSGRTGAGSHLAQRLRLEGRLAAATGDVAGARQAYRGYLLLRTTPDASRAAQRDSVLAEQSRLGGTP
jgi:hypothetical protein